MNWTSENYYFTKLEKKELSEFIHFYLGTTREFFHLDNAPDEEYSRQYENLIREDLLFFDKSIYYVMRDTKKHAIQASIRITYWDRETTLPIQQLFSIKKENLLIAEIDHFWHIGRFIISQKITGQRISILKKMLFDAFFPPFYLGNGLVIAECDKKLVRTLFNLGIPSYQLGVPIIYLYSETLPIYIKTTWLNSFIEKNKLAQYCFGNTIDAHKIFDIAKKIPPYKNDKDRDAN
ncbi:hypothetical protein [Sphingobacterium prati]|uniref:hypothetical protein n=1 Tax=Sphingobacterium prati TaxID=2737006 RepID=UPI0015582299|nr:hypothetical protein [Sphingobacterium prati]NPE47963.1 hypothetical protein [Sphingobacterium prati]